jgi:hypothetical protein
VTRVLGAKAAFGGSRVASFKRTSWGFNVTAAEGASYVAAVYPSGSSRAVRSLAANRAPGAVLVAKGSVKAGWRPRLKFPRRALRPGTYVYAVRLRAAMNPRRTTVLVSRTFTVR